MAGLTRFGIALLLATGGASVSPRIAAAAPMTFQLVTIGDVERCADRCVRVISAMGEITADTPKAFVNFIRENISDRRVRSVVFMHSPGGKVVASMELGMAFRKLGAAAVVARVSPPPPGSGQQAYFASAQCFSACVYALMGAKKRVVPPKSLVGIHRMALYEAIHDPDSVGGQSINQVFAEPGLVRTLAHYANQMGVSGDLVRAAEGINPDRIHIVSPQELRKWRLGSPKF